MADRVLEPVPALLHRYRPPEEIERGWFEDLLVHHRIWASSPTEFNDEDDCRARIDYRGSEDEHFRSYEGMFAKLGLDAADAKAEALDSLAKGVWKDSLAHESLRASMQTVFDNYGVICLCESGTSAHMWRLYAEQHRGICLRFETSKPPFSNVFRVKYLFKLHNVRFNDDPGAFVELLLTKGQSWKDEAEWRHVDTSSGKGYRSFPPSALKAVILGMNITPVMRSEAYRLMERWSPGVELLQAVSRPGQVDPGLEPLSVSTT
ncbi:MAG: DUF2971 domain-containing protein [Thermoanaerobaculia bacterium]